MENIVSQHQCQLRSAPQHKTFIAIYTNVLVPACFFDMSWWAFSVFRHQHVGVR